MRIVIIGAGYVGLVSGVCLAEKGHHVTCVDLDQTRVDAINAAKPPIFEEGLEALLRKHAPARFSATDDLATAVADADAVFIAVGTPLRDGHIDLSQVLGAAHDIGTALKARTGYPVVVVKSTVVPGTTSGPVRETLERASGKRAGEGFGLAMNPEFLTEGTAVHDFLAPDRLVLGAEDDRSAAVLEAIYAGFRDVPRVRTNASTAELIKYASNALLATSISFANEIGRVARAVGDIDVVDVQHGLHLSAYLTTRGTEAAVTAPLARFLEAGCGFGGSCLPKDVAALASLAHSLGVVTPMLDAVLDVNASQPAEMMRLLSRHFPTLGGVRVLVLGLAFKPDTDDVRESPAFPIIRALRRESATISAYDPVALYAARAELAGVAIPATLDAAVRDVDAIMLVTRWNEFRRIPALLAELPRPPLVVDGRRMLEPGSVARYEGIGRATGKGCCP
jgi:UDPglucose 6-dehydrogenase/GDP-mannose 6-dehydrogenase